MVTLTASTKVMTRAQREDFAALCFEPKKAHHNNMRADKTRNQQGHIRFAAMRGNGKIEIREHAVYAYGKSSRMAQRELQATISAGLQVKAEDLNPREGARVLTRAGFAVLTFYGYSGSVRRLNETGEYEIVYAMFDEGTVVIEIAGFCSERVSNPALAAAVEEMCAQEQEMDALEYEEKRHIIAAADKAGLVTFWHSDGSFTLMSKAEFAATMSQEAYYDMSADDYYEERWLASLVDGEMEGINTLSVSYNGDGLPEVDEPDYSDIEPTF